jgi:uncharacterized protein (TIGR02271 family)
MTMQQNLETWIDHVVCDPEGNKIGKVADIYVDNVTDQPEWLAVHTGLFGTKTSFVPLRSARPDGDAIVVPFDTDKVKGAPKVDPDGELEPEEEQRLYEYYNVKYSEDDAQDDTQAGAPSAAAQGDNAMTRSEEELRISKQSRETGRVRLRKYLVTDEQNVTVPVTREEVRIEREPITDANYDAATSGPDLTEGEAEVVLHEEQVNVNKTVVPKERVRLDTDTVTEDKTVTEQVRKERIDVDDNNR